MPVEFPIVMKVEHWTRGKGRVEGVIGGADILLGGREVEEEAIGVRVVADTYGLDGLGINGVAPGVAVAVALDVGDGEHGDEVAPVRFAVVDLLEGGGPHASGQLDGHVV